MISLVARTSDRCPRLAAELEVLSIVSKESLGWRPMPIVMVSSGERESYSDPVLEEPYDTESLVVSESDTEGANVVTI
jgi:hypothetical protein